MWLGFSEYSELLKAKPEITSHTSDKVVSGKHLSFNIGSPNKSMNSESAIRSCRTFVCSEFFPISSALSRIVAILFALQEKAFE